LTIDAHSAVFAVPKVFSAADAAETAVGAVVGAFFVGHPEVADCAVIFAELDSAVDAKVGLATLLRKTLSTNNLLDRKSIHIMMFRRTH